MTKEEIRLEILNLEAEREKKLRIHCKYVAARIQREIDKLMKQLNDMA